MNLSSDSGGLGSGCNSQMTTGFLPVVTTGSRVASFDIQGCKLGTVIVTAVLKLGTDVLYRALESVNIFGTPDTPVITRYSTGDGTVTLQLDLGNEVTDVYILLRESGVIGTARVLPFGGFGINQPTLRTATITGLFNGVEYVLAARSENSHGSTSRADLTVRLPLAVPTSLEVTPMPLHKAQLSWDSGSNPLPLAMRCR